MSNPKDFPRRISGVKNFFIKTGALSFYCIDCISLVCSIIEVELIVMSMGQIL